MTIETVHIDQIKANPWQPRQNEDTETIEQLAASIEKEGLLQVPVGRPAHGSTGIELAFGHSRLAAYRLLAQRAGDDEAHLLVYDVMPIDVRELSDEQMAELAIRENLDRKDLSPIEEARAMRRLMDEFGRTTEQVAELWGLKNASSVRTKLRLLNLPEITQELVHAGEIPERVGRQMIGIANASPKAADELAKEFAGRKKISPEEIEEEIGRKLESVSQMLCGSWEHSRVEGKWWMLDDEFEGPLEIKPAPLRDALLQFHDGDAKAAKVAAAGILASPEGGLHKDPEANRLVEHLLNPPACSSCRFHHVFRSNHYCSFNPCRITKRQNFKEISLARSRKARPLQKTPWYSPADGKLVKESYLHGDSDRLIMFKDGHEDLRLCERGTPFTGWGRDDDHPLKKHPFVDFGVVGKTAKAAIKSQKERYGGGNDESWQRQSARRELRDKIFKDLEQLTAPLFAQIFEPFDDYLPLNAMARLLDEFYDWRAKAPTISPKAKKADKVRALQSWLGECFTKFVVLSSRPDTLKQAVKKIEGEAKRYGISLPAGWAATWLAESQQALDTFENASADAGGE